MRWLLLLALLLLPSAAGQAVSAELEVLHAIEPSAFLFLPCRDINDNLDNGAQPGRPTETGFAFNDELTYNPCLEASVDIDVPSGASNALVTYNSSRSVEPERDALSVAAGPGLVASLQRGGGPEIGQVFGEGSSPWSREHLVDVAGASRLSLVWKIDELPLAPELGLVVLPGATYTVEVDDARVAFSGVDVLQEFDTQDEGQGREELRRDLRAVANVPVLGGEPTLTFRISNAWSIGHIEGPDGRELPLDAFTSREERGTLFLTIPPDVLAFAGPGTYTAVFSTTVPLEPSLALVPVLLLLAIVPVVAGIFATRGATRFRQRATAGYEATARNLFNAILLVWAGYAITGAYVLFGQLWPMVVAWPLQLPAAMVYGGFIITALAFVVLDGSWRRQLDVSMQEALLAKERTNQELKRSNDELEQFAYIASHDLQEPLRTVARFTQLLQRRYGTTLDADAQEFMAYSVEGAQRMQALLDDLLKYSRIDSRGTTFAPVDLEECLRHVKASLTERIENTGAQITHDPLPPVLGDARQLEQVLQNLISNAIKFCAPDVPPRIHISSEREDRFWAIRVKDNGIGIPEEHHQRIFTVFQRLHGRDAYEGTGIGLAICKKIVERHGGTIRAESSGDGTTFVFTLAPDERRQAV